MMRGFGYTKCENDKASAGPAALISYLYPDERIRTIFSVEPPENGVTSFTSPPWRINVHGDKEREQYDQFSRGFKENETTTPWKF